jgi:hypothetical protein
MRTNPSISYSNLNLGGMTNFGIDSFDTDHIVFKADGTSGSLSNYNFNLIWYALAEI